MLDPVLVDRFNAKWERADNGCWLWTASTAGRGYGQLKIPGERKQIYAHRLSWLINRGPVPEGRMVLHRCDTPRCVNPEHLFLGVAKDNQQDMKAKRRHLYGERNGNAKLTGEKVLRIRRQHALGGVTQRELAKLYDVAPMTISRIIRGERWASVPG